MRPSRKRVRLTAVASSNLAPSARLRRSLQIGGASISLPSVGDTASGLVLVCTFAVEIPGALCSQCGGPYLHDAPEWVDVTPCTAAPSPPPSTSRAPRTSDWTPAPKSLSPHTHVWEGHRIV